MNAGKRNRKADRLEVFERGLMGIALIAGVIWGVIV